MRGRPGRATRGGLERLLLTAAALLAVAGVGLLATVGWELYGTTWRQQGAQEDLKEQFEAGLDRAVTPPPAAVPADRGAGGAVGAVEAAPVAAVPVRRAGDVVAVLRIPRLGKGWEQAVVEGVGHAELAQGPGHYPRTPFFGEAGNVGVAGHRVTWGNPFRHLDRLRTGDTIEARTATGTYVYEVVDREIVTPDRTSVLRPDPTAPVDQPADGRGRFLTLTTCHPAYSAKQRLVVHAVQVSPESSASGATPGGVAGRGPQG